MSGHAGTIKIAKRVVARGSGHADDKYHLATAVIEMAGEIEGLRRVGIDLADKLAEWRANPEKFAEDGLVPPSVAALDTAEMWKALLTNATWLVPDGDGGISAEWTIPDGTISLSLYEYGGADLFVFKDGKCAFRRYYKNPQPPTPGGEGDVTPEQRTEAR